jgi:sugar lactone lactonase YvrE
MEHRATLLEGRCFLEGPRWRGDALYVSDLRGDEVLRVTLDGMLEIVATVPNPCGLGWLPDGRMLVVSTLERKLLRREPDGTMVEHADCAAAEAHSLNDLVVDRFGHAYVGRWGYDVFSHDGPRAAIGLLRVDPDGTVTETIGAIELANGMAITTDDRTLIVAETDGRRLTAFDLDDDGTVSKPHVWATLDLARPDGICLDVDNGVWVADVGADSFTRVVEGGVVTDVIRVPGQKAVACALGGDDGRTLLMMTTTGPTDREGARAQRPARIEISRVVVPGCERP